MVTAPFGVVLGDLRLDFLFLGVWLALGEAFSTFIWSWDVVISIKDRRCDFKGSSEEERERKKNGKEEKIKSVCVRRFFGPGSFFGSVCG